MFIGQQHLQKDIKVIAQQISRGNNQNILILGKSGYGKTTIAKLIADSAHVNYQYFVAGRDYVRFLYPIVIIDETHLFKNWEQLYAVMDNHKCSIIVLTTELGDLPEPLINRCITLYLKEYTRKELVEIAQHYCKGLRFSDNMINEIVDRSRDTPRVIENTINRIRLHIMADEFHYTMPYLKSLLDMFGVFEGGFTYFDIQYLDCLRDIGGKASLTTLCASLHQSRETITKYIEPFLIDKGYIIITSKGRMLQKEWRHK